MTEYGFHPSLVSLPGQGPHPRGMVADAEPLGEDGYFIDMGTDFDHFSQNVEQDNPAARNYTQFSKDTSENNTILKNRQDFEFAYRSAAYFLNKSIVPMPEEWWDFREEESTWKKYDPLYEADLLPCQRLIDIDIAEIEKIADGEYPDEMWQTMLDVDTQVTKAFNTFKREHLNSNPSNNDWSPN